MTDTNPLRDEVAAIIGQHLVIRESPTQIADAILPLFEAEVSRAQRVKVRMMGPDYVQADYMSPTEVSALVDPLRDQIERFEAERSAGVSECGGCKGHGSHRRHCQKNPDYSRARELADMAEDLGDQMSNWPGAANACYRASAVLRSEAR